LLSKVPSRAAASVAPSPTAAMRAPVAGSGVILPPPLQATATRVPVDPTLRALPRPSFVADREAETGTSAKATGLAASIAGTAAVAAVVLGWRRRRERRGRLGVRQAPLTQADGMSGLPLPSQEGSSVRVWKPSDFAQDVGKYLDGSVPQELISGVRCGWHGVDEIYRPVPGELTVVTGKPGSGKTEWLLSLVTNIAEKRDWRVALCCFEASKGDLLNQLLEKRAKRHFRMLTERDLDVQWVDDHFTCISTPFTEITIDRILANAQWVHDRTPLRGLVIDPYNYIAPDADLGSDSETDYVSVMLTKAKQFAERNTVHVWLVAHPGKRNRWVGPRPQLYDIAGSAHFYNKCDMGVVLDRSQEADGANLLQVYVDKVRNRDAGRPGVAKLWFNPLRRSYGEHQPETVANGTSANGTSAEGTSRDASQRGAPRQTAAQRGQRQRTSSPPQRVVA